MPFWKPNSLTEEDAWQVTAFLLRENGLWTGNGELNIIDASQVEFQAVTPAPASANPCTVLFSQMAVMAGLPVIGLIVLLVSVRPKK